MCDPVTALVAGAAGLYMNSEKRKQTSMMDDAQAKADAAAKADAQGRIDAETNANIAANQALAADKQKRRANVLATGGSTDALGGGTPGGTSVLGGGGT